MPADNDRITDLLTRPAESLSVEVKTWLNPTQSDGIAKIVKAVLALHNRNGGYLVIGHNNATMAPDHCPFADEVPDLFHTDVVQGIVSRYASVPIEVSVELRDLDGQLHPVIIVPEGVRTPIAIKRDLRADGGHYLLREGDVYVRTLTSNGTPSTARAGPSDWGDLMETCFENREADIGRFFRRHLADRDFSGFAALLAGSAVSKPTALRSRAFEALQAGDTAFASQVDASAMPTEEVTALSGLTMTVALALDPLRDGALATEEFLNKFSSGNPQYTGWPTWLDSRGFRNVADRPRVINGSWEAFINALGDGWGKHLDFMRMDPTGAFFLKRLMQDDLVEKITPRTGLDVILMIYRVTEVVATGLSVSRSSGWETDATAGFAFRWSGLSQRKLVPWVNAFRGAGGSGKQAIDDRAESYVELPLGTPHSALAPHVEQAVRPLFVAFEGFTPSSDLIEECVRKVIERKMDS